MGTITVLFADDNLIVRAGVCALLALDPSIEVVGEAADYDSVIAQALRLQPQVLVTDIRMPPSFQDEGIEAAREVRKLLPGTGVVVLSQYDDPEYAVSLLADGADGYAYLLKDRVSDSDLLGQAIRAVAAGGSLLDPQIVQELMSPVRAPGELAPEDEHLLRQIAEGRTVGAIAAARDLPPEEVDAAIEALFLRLARDAGSGRHGALQRLRMLHAAIVSREEQGETLSRLLPGGLAEKVRTDWDAMTRRQQLDVTVLMSDVRGYSGISERTDLAVLAGQLNEHRNAMNTAVVGCGGTVMQYIGDAVLAVFGAPDPQEDHARQAVRAAQEMHARQRELDAAWAVQGLDPFVLGIGLCTGEVVAALFGDEQRLEYTVIGDTVNLAQRLQDLARPGGTVASESTVEAAGESWPWESMGARAVKGRANPVNAFHLPAAVLEATR